MTAKHIEALRGLSFGQHQVGLWWLGQSGFAMRGAGTTVLIDPFLQPRPDRLVPPPFAPEEASGVDVLLCTHDHIDHLDWESLPGLAAASPSARIVVPAPIVPLVVEHGIDAERVIGAQPGEPVKIGEILVRPVPARHGIHVADAYTFGQELSDGLYRYLGYVIEMGSVRVYHAGDTILYEGMEDWLHDLEIDLALLPINGRVEEREARDLVGNLGPREAAGLAGRIGAGAFIPMHYDMFAGNLGDPGEAVRAAREESPGVTVLVPTTEHPFVYTAVRA